MFIECLLCTQLWLCNKQTWNLECLAHTSADHLGFAWSTWGLAVLGSGCSLGPGLSHMMPILLTLVGSLGRVRITRRQCQSCRQCQNMQSYFKLLPASHWLKQVPWSSQRQGSFLHIPWSHVGGWMYNTTTGAWGNEVSISVFVKYVTNSTNNPTRLFLFYYYYYVLHNILIILFYCYCILKSILYCHMQHSVYKHIVYK